MENIIGTLTDINIQEYVDKNLLIKNNFTSVGIKQACYELRASNIFYNPIESSDKRTVPDNSDYILLKPNQITVIITEEELFIPDDILGRILTKGSLFSLGINAVNTYVDPGFKGRLGIVFQNQSTKYIKIKVGQPIAKIEFSKLHKSVQTPYHGQHGYDTEIWPIKSDLLVSDDELEKVFKVKKSSEEIGLLYGNQLQSVFDRVLVYERRFFGGLILYIILTLLYIGASFYFDGTIGSVLTPLASAVAGVISNFLFTAISFFTKRKK